MQAEFPEKLGFLFEPCRYKVAYGGRGSGKSWAFARALLLTGIQHPLRILCARETQRSITDSVHRLLADQIAELGVESHYTVQQANIIGSNGTDIIFAGIRQNVHNIKSFEAIDVCWVEEAQTVSKHSWDILIPTIRKENSEIWVSFNPELETDDTYKRFVLNPPKNARVEYSTYKDNPWFPAVLEEERQHCKATESESSYNHIWEGLCLQAVEGAVYEKELATLDKEQRITSIPYDRSKPCETFWDIGDRYTSIWIAQAFPFEHRLIDYVHGEALSLAEYLKILQSKPYVYSTHWLPHDARAPQLGTGRSIEEQMRSGGFNVKIVQNIGVENGINAVRTVFPQCWFDGDKCADGIQALRHYRYAPEGVLGQLQRKPLHDINSHPADAFRYFAVAIKHPEKEQPKRKRPDIRMSAWS